MDAIHQDAVSTLFTLMKNTHDKRMYQRYQAVYLFLQDYSAEKIAIIIGRSEKTVYNYVNSYNEHEIEGLKPGKAHGASYKLTPQQRAELVQVIVDQLPTDVGFSAKFNWTLAIIVTYIEREWHVTYTQRGVSKLLHALGLSYTRPTYVLAKADPAKQKAFLEKTFPELKKTAESRV